MNSTTYLEKWNMLDSCKKYFQKKIFKKEDGNKCNI